MSALGERLRAAAAKNPTNGPPPPGPFRPRFWRSPLRGARLTTALGLLLLAGVTIVAVTGFLSHAAYEPGRPGNAIVRHALPLTFPWPTGPSWLYAVNQGLHVNVGLVTIPVLLAKLWSVIPRLFAWPPARDAAHAIERLSVALLVGSVLFQFATGVANMQNWYPFHFNFVVAHYYGAVVFVAALVIHIVVKMPTMGRAIRLREEGDLAAIAPAPPTISRRGFFGLVGVGSLALVAVNVGESIGGPLRRTALLAPRREHFPVNRTAQAARITLERAGPAWRLDLGDVQVSRADLLAMELRTEELTIGCVEGWSTTQTWQGVPLAELARLAGRPGASEVTVTSLERRGALRRVTLGRSAIEDERSLLALRVNGTDLSMDHGFPARIIVPGLPGVHNTKWVSSLRFLA